jgi:hypothetical protein
VTQPPSVPGESPGENPYRPRNNPGGGFFWKTLSAKASAWTWGQRDRELMILEMSGQAVFCRWVFENPWETLEQSFAQKGNKPVAVWDRLPVGVIEKGLQS